MKYTYWLAAQKSINANRRRFACDRAGGPEALYHMEEKQLTALQIFSEAEILRLLAAKKTFDLDGEWETFSTKEMEMIPYFHPSYPRRLLELYDPPFALFVKGTLPDETKKSVAIIGARSCSEYGRSVARKLGKLLAEQGVPVVSGLALGVDSAAQAGALSGGGDTYAILGCGCDLCYPRSSKNVYENILKGHGGVISELVPGVEPLPLFFPMRNRIISGLADVLIIVEAKKKSGSLITADFALEQGKDVFAVPGRYGEPLSEGCNRLIEQGAGILYDGESFLKNIGIVDKNEKKKQKIHKVILEKEEQCVYSSLDLTPKFINSILEETKLDLLTVLQALDGLKKKQLVFESFQNHFCKTL